MISNLKLFTTEEREREKIPKCKGVWKLKAAGLLILIVLFTCSVNAGINKRNGTFFISYVDITTPYEKGQALQFWRTYRSTSTYKGWFGEGWGSVFETRLQIQPDGSALVTENGQGQTYRFGGNDSASNSPGCK